MNVETFKERFFYNPETGALVWKRRPREHFKSDRVWRSTNSRCAGKMAGGVSTSGYQTVMINGKRYRAHRLIWLYMTGSWPNGEIDHIDGNRANNKWSNLRDVSASDNKKNRRVSSNSQSGIMGVCRDNHRNKWRAHITISDKHIAIGRYDSFFDACCARKSAEVRHGFHPNHGH